MLIRVELVRLLSETKKENGAQVFTWSEIGKLGLYEHRKVVTNLLNRCKYNVRQTSEGIEVSKK